MDGAILGMLGVITAMTGVCVGLLVRVLGKLRDLERRTGPPS